MATRRARHRRSRRYLPVALGGLVVVGVAGGVIAIVGTDATAPTSSATAGPTATSDPTEEATPAPDDVIACRDAIEAAEVVVNAARTGVDHWAAHVQARTDLLAGKITEAEMRTTWKATRLAGPEDLAALAEAGKAMEPQAEACAHVEPSSVPAELSEAVNRCLERGEAAETAVEAGRGAVADWESHLEDMARFADGDFDAAQAQHLWVVAWEKAPANIDAFRVADKALQGAPACELSA